MTRINLLPWREARRKEQKSEKEKLLARMNIIQELQTRRPEIVHLFDELARSIPDGIYLTEARQEGRTITLKGVAQSNARVSSFMRNLDRSAWFTKPRLEVIEADDKSRVRISRFVLTVQQASLGAVGTGKERAS